MGIEPVNDDELKQKIADAAFDEDGKTMLTCAAAHGLARKHSVPIADIGRLCNESGIKLCRCQLGCFR